MHSIRRLLREVHHRSIWQVLTVYVWDPIRDDPRLVALVAADG